MTTAPKNTEYHRVRYFSPLDSNINKEFQTSRDVILLRFIRDKMYGWLLCVMGNSSSLTLECVYHCIRYNNDKKDRIFQLSANGLHLTSGYFERSLDHHGFLSSSPRLIVNIA